MGWSGVKDYGFGGKHRTKEQDDEYRSRAQGVPRPRVWTDDKIAEFIDEMLTLYKKILMEDSKVSTTNRKLKQETIKDMNTMMRRLLDFKEKYYPPVQKSVNVEVNFNEMLERWREVNKEREKEKDEKVIEVTKENGQG